MLNLKIAHNFKMAGFSTIVANPLNPENVEPKLPDGRSALSSGFKQTVVVPMKIASDSHANNFCSTMEGQDNCFWTALITGYVQGSGQDQEVIDLFYYMIQGHVTPNHFAFSSVIKAGANLPDLHIGEQLHAQTVKLGLSSVNCVRCGLSTARPTTPPAAPRSR